MERTMRVCFEYDGTRLVLECDRCQNVWESIERYDLEHGTDFFDRIDEESIMGVDLPDWDNVPVVTSWTDVESATGLDEVTCTKLIRTYGTSLAINVTKEARLMHIDRGDAVEVVIRKKRRL